MKPQNKNQVVDFAKSFLDKATETAQVMSHAHPITIALLLHAGAKAVRILIQGDPGTETPRMTEIHKHLEGIETASFAIGTAAATVPVISGSLNLVGQYLGSRSK